MVEPDPAGRPRSMILATRPVAIIGLAVRLPGAPDLDSLRVLLAGRRSGIGRIGPERFDTRLFHHPRKGEAGRSYTFAAGVLDDVRGFDAGFFGISPREAQQIDPQQRLALELAWEAIEDAGLRQRSVRGSDTAVFVGASSMDYLFAQLGDPWATAPQQMLGTALSIIANRISFALDLRGESLTLDTACSSSLVALHQAIHAVASGRAPLALAGGVNMLLAPYPFIGFSRAGMLSPTGRCHSFGAKADGYVRAEGGGMAMLKPLDRALADGDRIRAVVLGSGANADGRTSGLSLPSADAQAALLERIYAAASLDPDRLGYLEAHGTGTQAGDPVESEAIGRAVGRMRSRPLPIGSIKSNVGHLEPASGMAGLAKAVLGLLSGRIEATLCDEPNPLIPWAEHNLVVTQRPVELADDALVGISSFGFGGANAHVVLQAAPRVRPLAATQRQRDPFESRLPPLLVSARSAAGLDASLGSWQSLLATTDEASLAPTLRAAARLRDHHPHRAAIQGETGFDLVRGIEALRAGRPAPEAQSAVASAATLPLVAFVFSGNGAQWPGMGQAALAGDPSLREAIDEVDRSFQPEAGWSIRDLLERGVGAQELAATEVAQPLLFALQVAIVRGLAGHGIRPDLVLGHSVGEIAAAWASGGLDLAAATNLVRKRSQAQARTHGQGRMAALGRGLAEAQAAIAGLHDGLAIAAINAPGQVTVAGPAEAVTQLGALAERRGWLFRDLGLEYAFHSPAMDPIEELVQQGFAGIRPGKGQGPRFVSTVTGQSLDPARLDHGYWWRNLREPVRFADAVAHAAAQGATLFVEIGPQPVLQSYLRETLRSERSPAQVTFSFARRGATQPLREAAARLHVHGADLSASPMFDGPLDAGGLAALDRLPKTAWVREAAWFQPTQEAERLTDAPADHPLLGWRRGNRPSAWRITLDPALQPWLSDHRVGGAIVLPAAGFAEMALAAARAAGAGPSVAIRDLELRRALVLADDRARLVETRLAEEGRAIEIRSRPVLSEEGWTLHASARVAEPQGMTAQSDTAGEEGVAIGAAEVDRAARARGLDYGPSFRPVGAVVPLGRSAALASLSLPSAWLAAAPADGYESGWLLPPPLLDGAFQSLLALLARSGSGATLLPVRIRRLELAPGGAAIHAAHVTVHRAGERGAEADVALLDEAGVVVAVAEGCGFAQVPLGRVEQAPRLFRVADFAVTLPAERSTAPATVVPAMERLDPPRSLPPRIGQAALLVEGFVAAASIDGIGELARGSESFAIGEWLRDGTLAPASAPLLERLLTSLSVQGLAVQSDGAWRLAPDPALPSATEIWRAVIAEAPELGAELTAIAHAAETLPQRLREGGSPKLSDALLSGPLLGQPVEEEALRACLAAIEAWPTERPVRCLLLGTSQVRVARALLAATSERKLALALTLVDADRSELDAAAARIGRGPLRRFLALDVGDPSFVAQAGRFDLVLAAGATAFRSIDSRSASSLGQCLASGGALIAVLPAASTLSGLVLGDPRGQGEARWIASVLQGAGFASVRVAEAPDGFGAARVTAQMVHAGQAAAPAPRFRLLPAEDATARAVGLHLTASEDEAGTDRVLLMLGATDAAAASMRLLDAVSASREAQARLWVVTSAATTDRVQAALWGLARVARNEQAIDLRLVDLDPALPPERAAFCLLDELRTPDAETEVFRTRNGRRASRVAPATAEPSVRPVDAAPALSIESPGLLETLRWRNRPVAAPGHGEVRIEVEAAGLNFRDVMWAQGLLPEELLAGGFAGPGLGMECAGTVVSVGPGVRGWREGDRVMAFAPRALARRVVTRAEACLRIPEGIGFEAAATIPVAFLTAHWTLARLARIAPGETLLVHGGAGGVGLAAVQVAKARGARVAATAGNPQKRAFLRAYGADFVSDSRSLAFAREVREWTGGRGVDVVLNSLAGEALEASLGLLRPFGRFIELGKRDFALNSRVGLRPLARNVAFFGVDADALLGQGAGMAAELFGEIEELFRSGGCIPLPFRRFAAAEARDAFRLMQASGHVGKIVVAPPEAASAAHAPPRFRSDCVYVVSGGVSGVGLALAEWFARSGVRRLALLSRRGAVSEPDQDVLARLSAQGVEVACHACDVADQGQLAATLARIRAAQGPIGGIVHAAAVLEDGVLAQLDEAALSRVLAPKLDGAWNLHRLTEGDPIETFLLLSSATTAIGNPGQGAYVAANHGVEAIARARRAENRPGVALALGPVADAGMLARNPEVRRLLEKRLGLRAMSVPAILDSLPRVLASPDPVVILADLEGAAARARLPILSSPTYEMLPEAETAEDEADPDALRARILAAGPAEARDLLAGLLAVEVGRILGLGVETIERHRPLSEIGMDSLMAVELGLVIEQRLGTGLSGLSIAGGASVATLSETLVRTLQGTAGEGNQTEDPPPGPAESAATTETLRLPDRRHRERSA